MNKKKWKKTCWICKEKLGKEHKYIYGIKGLGIVGKRVHPECEKEVVLQREYA